MSCLSSERDRLRPVAEALGVEVAEKVAAAIVPERGWIASIDEHSEAVARRIEPLAHDPALRVALSRICAERARQHLLEMATAG